MFTLVFKASNTAFINWNVMPIQSTINILKEHYKKSFLNIS